MRSHCHLACRESCLPGLSDCPMTPCFYFAGLLYQGLCRQTVLVLKMLTVSGLGEGPSAATLHSHPQTPSAGDTEPLGSTLAPEPLPLLVLLAPLPPLCCPNSSSSVLLAGLPGAASELPLDSPTIALSTPLLPFVSGHLQQQAQKQRPRRDDLAQSRQRGMRSRGVGP